MEHWTAKFYRRVDSNDPEIYKLLSSDIRCQVGNNEPTFGVEALFAGPIGRNVRVINGSTHAFLNIWDVDTDTAVVESNVTYHRKDGKDVTVPAMTVLHRDAAGSIDDIRLYIDTAPLFKGWLEYGHEIGAPPGQ